MGLGGSRQGNVALDLNDCAVERNLAQGTRHGVATELQLFAHLGKRRCIQAGLVKKRDDPFASLSHHACRRGGRMRIEYLGALGGAHATRAALGNQSRGNTFICGRPRSMGNGTGRKARLLGSRRVHGGQGRRQCIHRSVERGRICIQRAIRASKRASSALRHQSAQCGVDLADTKIQSLGDINRRNRQHLQRQPSAHTARGIAGLKRRKQCALPRRKLARATAARKQHTPTANEHNGRIRQHHGMVSGSQRQRLLQAHLYGTGLAHRHGGLALQKHDSANNLGRAGHHMHTRARLEHARLGALAAEVGERHHKAQRLAKAVRNAQHLATVKRRGTVTN